MEELKEGYIFDYISGIQVKETPEEIEAVQPFSKILVDDYGYPKKNIHTRPQYRVKVRPSDVKKEYPVDIAVFNSSTHSEDNIHIIIECKKKSRKDGLSQLQDYLRFSNAYLGVWFNGEERLYLHKIEKGGKIFFEEIPNIPRYGERVEDIGKFKRKDLKPAENLKPTFKAIRNYLAANAVGITRDEVFASQIINLIFCKIYDERFTKPEDTVKFRAGVDEDDEEVRKKLSIDATEMLELYDLGHKWKQDGDGNFVMEGLVDKQPPQILFIERCFQMLKPGGRMGIVLLESIFGMPKYQYVVDYIRRKSKILAVVTLPEDLFQPNTHAKCCVLICQKYKEDESFESCGDYNIFMSDVKWCGHDSRGNVTYRYLENGEKTVLDEIPLVAERYKEMKQEDAQL